MPTSAARSASSGVPATSRTSPSSRRTCRPRRQASSAACTSTSGQDDLWIVADGRAFVALVDLRPMLDGTASAPRIETRELRADEWVVIPTGIAHGFLALDPLQLIYLVTNEYDGSDELGFAWDDPAVAVDWPPLAGTPDGRPILSERDGANPPLADLVARMRSDRA